MAIMRPHWIQSLAHNEWVSPGKYSGICHLARKESWGALIKLAEARVARNPCVSMLTRTMPMSRPLGSRDDLSLTMSGMSSLRPHSSSPSICTTFKRSGQASGAGQKEECLVVLYTSTYCYPSPSSFTAMSRVEAELVGGEFLLLTHSIHISIKHGSCKLGDEGILRACSHRQPDRFTCLRCIAMKGTSLWLVKISKRAPLMLSSRLSRSGSLSRHSCAILELRTSLTALHQGHVPAIAQPSSPKHFLPCLIATLAMEISHLQSICSDVLLMLHVLANCAPSHARHTPRGQQNADAGQIPMGCAAAGSCSLHACLQWQRNARNKTA